MLCVFPFQQNISEQKVTRKCKKCSKTNFNVLKQCNCILPVKCCMVYCQQPKVMTVSCEL